MNRSDRNPLREGSGKGDKPRNCHNPKFRNNFDKIRWLDNVDKNEIRKFIKKEFKKNKNKFNRNRKKK